MTNDNLMAYNDDTAILQTVNASWEIFFWSLQNWIFHYLWLTTTLKREIESVQFAAWRKTFCVVRTKMPRRRSHIFVFYWLIDWNSKPISLNRWVKMWNWFTTSNIRTIAARLVRCDNFQNHREAVVHFGKCTGFKMFWRIWFFVAEIFDEKCSKMLQKT